jgi:hypothetical protein
MFEPPRERRNGIENLFEFPQSGRELIEIYSPGKSIAASGGC